MRGRYAVAFAVAGLVLLATACEDKTIVGGEAPAYTLEDAFPNLSFVRPVDIRNAGDGSHRLFVVEQTGKILVFSDKSTAPSASTFLDITSEVAAPGGEMGLLGLAFHPQYTTNGTFFVYYTATTGTGNVARVSRFHVSAADSNAADPASETVLLEMSERMANHNGGGLCFDGNGYLCIGVGDEGGEGDYFENGQNRATLQGSILRLDVDQNVNTPPYYGIPPDNPFAGNTDGYREEIYAYGMRNPWRISYDANADHLWVADVGQDSWEEIDIVTAGGNYGWNCREGKHPYTGPPGSPSPACQGASGFVDPVWEYSHQVGESITGGYVYHGSRLPALDGHYVYGDFTTGKVWALAAGDAPGSTQLLVDTSLYLPTFGTSEDGELFVAAYLSDGTPTAIYRLVPRFP